MPSIDREIITRFAEAGFQVSPDSLEIIRGYDGPVDHLVDIIVSQVDPSVFVIQPSHLQGINQVEKPPEPETPGEDGKSDETPGPEQPVATEVTGETVSGMDESGGQVGPEMGASGLEDDVEAFGAGARPEVVFDITDRSTCVGEYDDFVRYFRNRYTRIYDILQKRVRSRRPIEAIDKGNGREEIGLIGLVSEIRTTKNGHRIIELEDPTGSFPALINKDRDQVLFEKSRGVIHDEVIGVVGVPSQDGGILYANDIVWPDIPSYTPNRAKEPGYALLLSDIHVGSYEFLDEAWERMIAWLRGEIDDGQGLHEKVRHVVVAGDIVDGIGVYPGQEKDLAIKDVYEQYERAGEYLREIPRRVNLIISPGNHDVVRQAEPQPALPEHIRNILNVPGATYVGSPSLVSLDGVKILVYHGRSIDDLIGAIPGQSYTEPHKTMIEMLRRRHISPIYGSRVSIAPEETDYLVIDPIPDVFHCGHVHTIGVDKYRGVTVVNSGTWQSQTEFQKRMNIQPEPAIAPLVDLQTLQVSTLHFA